jgi:ABC-type glycerol-3-phosphate transport system substrate-binding protein
MPIAGRLAAELIPGSAMTIEESPNGPVEVKIRRRLDGHFTAKVRVNGKPVSMIVDTGATSIVLTPEDAEKAGIDPKSLTTWDALAAAAGKLTREKDGRVEVWGLGMPLAPIKTESTPVLIGMLDQDKPVFDGCKPNYATPTGVKALEYTAKLIASKATPQDALVQNVDDVTDQFTAGQYAMAISSILRHGVIAKNAKFGADNLGVLAWPSWSGEKPGPMPVSGWWVAAWSKSPRLKEAAKFIDYMVSP